MSSFCFLLQEGGRAPGLLRTGTYGSIGISVASSVHKKRRLQAVPVINKEVLRRGILIDMMRVSETLPSSESPTIPGTGYNTDYRLPVLCGLILHFTTFKQFYKFHVIADLYDISALSRNSQQKQNLYFSRISDNSSQQKGPKICVKISLFGGNFSNLARFGGKDDMMTLLGYSPKT